MTPELIKIHDAVAEARARVRAIGLASAGLEDDGERDALEEIARLAGESIAQADKALAEYSRRSKGIGIQRDV